MERMTTPSLVPAWGPLATVAGGSVAAMAPSAELMMSMEPLALATASVSAACGCSGGAALTAMAVTPRPLSGSPLGGDWI